MKVPEDLPQETVPEVKPPERTSPNLAPLPPGPERTTGNAAENPHIATGYTAVRRQPPTFEDPLQRKTFSQTVDEARRTMFEVARNPRSPAALPTGRRSLFGALSKARQDIKATNIRRAREQGLVPPMPAQSPADPGVEPNAYSAAAPPAPGAYPMDPALAPTSATGLAPVPEASSDAPGPLSNAEPAPTATPTSSGRRGLIGLLFQPRDR
jgi:hypothetical protein